jgi:tetratricopeptide (TPR) repeat protein
LKKGVINKDSRKNWEIFLLNSLEYWEEFFYKWVVEKPDNSLIIKYEDLVKSPLKLTEMVLSFLKPNCRIDKSWLQKVIKSEEIEYKNYIKNFKHFDSDKFKKIQSDMRSVLEIEQRIHHSKSFEDKNSNLQIAGQVLSELNIKDPKGLYRLGRIAYQLNQPEKCLKYLSEAIRISNSFSSFFYKSFRLIIAGEKLRGYREKYLTELKQTIAAKKCLGNLENIVLAHTMIGLKRYRAGEEKYKLFLNSAKPEIEQTIRIKFILGILNNKLNKRWLPYLKEAVLIRELDGNISTAEIYEQVEEGKVLIENRMLDEDSLKESSDLKRNTRRLLARIFYFAGSVRRHKNKEWQNFYREGISQLGLIKTGDSVDDYKIGWGKFMLGDFEGSVNHFKKIMDDSRLSEKYRILVNLFLIRLNQIGEETNLSNQNLEKKIKDLNKLSAKELYETASQAKNINLTSIAQKQFKRIIDITVNKTLKSGACFHLGEIFFNKKNYRQAKDLFNKCLNMNENHKKSRFYLERIAEIDFESMERSEV